MGMERQLVANVQDPEARGKVKIPFLGNGKQGSDNILGEVKKEIALAAIGRVNGGGERANGEIRRSLRESRER